MPYYTKIKDRGNRKIAMSQVTRTCTLNMSLRAAVITKSLVENTLMRQLNNKVESVGEEKCCNVFR